MFIILLMIASIASATDEVWVNGYTREDGTFVTGHYRTMANETKCDNWTTAPNINPHTGAPGTRAACNPVQQTQYQNTTTPRYNSSTSVGGVSSGAGGGLTTDAAVKVAVGIVAIAGIATIATVIARDIKKREMEEATPEGYIALRVANGKELAEFPRVFKDRYLTDWIGKDVLRIFENNNLEDFDIERFKLAWEEIESYFYTDPKAKRRAHEVLIALVELHKTGKM